MFTAHPLQQARAAAAWAQELHFALGMDEVLKGGVEKREDAILLS